jgi:DNA-formamidopyrimidine glycosylase
MPEISEAYNIAKKIKKIRIRKINIINSKMIKNDISWIENSDIEDIFNYGKVVIFKISKKNISKYLVSQLGMTGSWFNDYSRRDNKHNQLELIQDKKNKIIYSDIRKFGNIKIYDSIDDIIKTKKWSINLEKVTTNTLFQHINKIKSNKTIKELILDQKKFPGIGNYLASEILFKAKINPKKFFSDIDQVKRKDLSKAIIHLISITKKYGGFSFYGGYVLPDGSLGLYKNHALIYRKERCPLCNNPVKKIYIKGRATFFCKQCQGK